MIVSGRVQGVGFRWFARAEAERLGLSGWARNRRDGSVEVEVVGSRALIDKLADRLREGPSSSTVDDVAVQPLPVAQGVAAGFEIRSSV